MRPGSRKCSYCCRGHRQLWIRRIKTRKNMWKLSWRRWESQWRRKLTTCVCLWRMLTKRLLTKLGNFRILSWLSRILCSKPNTASKISLRLNFHLWTRNWKLLGISRTTSKRVTSILKELRRKYRSWLLSARGRLLNCSFRSIGWGIILTNWVRGWQRQN